MTRQPAAEKPLYTFEDYTDEQGRKALSARLDVRDMGRYYAECRELAGHYERDWNSLYSGWGDSNKLPKYVPRKIHNAEQAIQAVADFQFPLEVKQAAARASRKLVGIFENVARLYVTRDLTSGRLDRRKIPAIARHTDAGTFDLDKIRPYKRTEPRQVKIPTVAILGSAGNAEMWRDSDYIPRILTVTLGVLWACEAAGLQTYAALTKGNCQVREKGYSEGVSGYMLAEPGKTTSPKVYAVPLHRDLWRHGEMTLQSADYKSTMRLMRFEGYTSYVYGYGWLSRDGGNAVRWARQVLQADLVLAIGQITDADQADVKLDAKFDIEQAVTAIAEQVKKGKL